MTPNMVTRSSFRTPHWIRVNPARSSTALLTPVTKSTAIASSATGHTPMKTSATPSPPARLRTPSSAVPSGKPECTDRAGETAEADRGVQEADAAVAHVEQLDRRHNDKRG